MSRFVAMWSKDPCGSKDGRKPRLPQGSALATCVTLMIALLNFPAEVSPASQEMAVPSRMVRQREGATNPPKQWDWGDPKFAGDGDPLSALRRSVQALPGF